MVAAEARALAVGSPALENLTVVDSLGAALDDCTVSIGFTRRKGAVRHVHPSTSRLLEEFPAYMQVGVSRLVLHP